MKDFINDAGRNIPTVLDYCISNRQKGRGWGRLYGLYDYDLGFMTKLKLLLKYGS